MDLFRILDSPPEPAIIDPNNLVVDAGYAKSGDYKVLTPLTDFQKELFDQIVSLHYSDILKFYIQFQNDDADLKDQLIIDSLRVLLENSSLVSIHPYLLIEHFFPKNLTSKDIYKKLIETSGKFKILNDLISLIESQRTVEKFNLVMVSKPGRCMDLIESLLLAHSCQIKRYSGEKLSNYKNKKTHPSREVVDDSFCVHLLPSELEKLNTTMYQELLTCNLNLLISFDISVNVEDQFVQDLLVRNQIPVLRLVPNNTIEHIALYFRNSFKDKSDREYLKHVTALIVCLRDRVGIIPSELKSIYSQDLKYLQEWFKSIITRDHFVPWPLPDLRPIKTFDSFDVEKSLLSEVKFENEEDELLQLPNHYKISPKTKTSYYKSKRSDPRYITSPIEHSSYNKITGISSTIPENTKILTHKLILNFNLILQKQDLLKQEYDIFEKVQPSRDEQVAFTKSEHDKLSDEIKELKEKIALANDDLNKKQVIADDLKNELRDIDLKFEANESKNDYLKRKELKDAIDLKVVNKKQENEYMLKEIDNAKNSIKESETKIEELTLDSTRMMKLINDQQLQPLNFEKTDNSKIIKANQDLAKILEKNLKKINDIPISQKLRINGVNSNLFGSQVARRS